LANKALRHPPSSAAGRLHRAGGGVLGGTKCGKIRLEKDFEGGIMFVFGFATKMADRFIGV
jgi:hypothetical protein